MDVVPALGAMEAWEAMEALMALGALGALAAVGTVACAEVLGTSVAAAGPAKHSTAYVHGQRRALEKCQHIPT